MTRYIKSLVILAACAGFLPTGSAHAQLSEGGTPKSFQKSLRSDVQTVTTRPIDRPSLMAEDDEDQTKGVPYRFGYPFEVEYDMTNSGTWEPLPDGGRIWRLKIECPGAYSINLVYRYYWLPPGATMYVYNDDRSHVIGAFTERNNKEYLQFATAPVKGDACVIEYYEPAGVAAPGVIAIERIVHAYRDLFNRDVVKEAAGFGSSGYCNNNVNCPEGALWQDDKRSVAMILTSGGYRICTGALVNNVREDLTPYFLTANHCLGGESSWIFMFNYESPNCANNDGPTWMTVQGSIKRANYAYSDFALLELLETPPDSYSVYYSGWSAVNEAAQSSVGIHHPSGDIKKISFDYDPVVSANYGTSGEPSHWRVIQWDDGTTEPGSSGSPLFDSLTHRIIGQLHGGTASCASLTSDYYGKFAQSWDYGGNAATRLKDWLDPDNTGTVVIDGIDPLGVTFSGAPTFGNAPLEVQFTGSSQLVVDTWTYDFGDGDQAYVQSPAHTYSSPGVYDVSLEILAEGETRSRVRPNYIIALADTLKGSDTTLEKYSTLVLTVDATNYVPLHEIIVPVMYTGSLNMVLDSFSTVGCRTEYFELQAQLHSYLAGKQATYRLLASGTGTSPDLPVGTGPVIKLHFHSTYADPGDSTLVDFSGYSSYQPVFSSSLATYEPAIVSPMVTVPICCLGLRGDANVDGSTNVSDLTFLVAYLFAGGPESSCPVEADVDGTGFVNVADITYLVQYLFAGGPAPWPCP